MKTADVYCTDTYISQIHRHLFSLLLKRKFEEEWNDQFLKNSWES